jgi:glutathione synthase/RimK-type ligase-like ATP-grasp enzyme
MEPNKKIGLLVGREWSFPPAFIEEVNSRDAGVTAEYVKLGGTLANEPCEYAVIIDRISHEIPYYRTYLKNAMFQGSYIINNPFWWSADDKFFGASLAEKLGVASPKTVALPSHSYVDGVVNESLRNLEYPLDWQRFIDYVGLPAILKDAWGGGWKHVYVVHTQEELLYHYDQTGTLCMMLQEYIEWDQFVRCLCIGQEKIMPIKYSPQERRYYVEENHLSPQLYERISEDARKINRALGYDMNSIEFAVRDGIPYAIDFTNPAPDMDINSLTPVYFEWAVKSMAELAIDRAHNPPPQRTEMRWSRFLG